MAFESRIDSEVRYLCSIDNDGIVEQGIVDSVGLYNLFEEIWKSINDQYSLKTNHGIVQDEYAFLRKLLYLRNTNQNSFSMKDYLQLIDDNDEHLNISSSSLNLLLNRFFFVEQYNDLKKQYAVLKRDSTWNFRRLLSAHCLRMRYRIGKAGQFTYNGERFVIDSFDLGQKETDNLKAVRFCRANSLCSINSLRLIEKVLNYLRKIEGDDNPSPVIKIAAFGRFSDQKDQSKLWLEKLADQGYFTDEKERSYGVQVINFELKQFTEFKAIFEERIESGNKLIGNLLDPDFLYSVCNRYDIVCLMDMGCLYRDTNRFEDSQGDSPYEAVRARSRTIEYICERKGVNEVDLSSYDGLYNAFIKWIENYFYGKKHSYEFDARLFSALMELNTKLKSNRRSTSVYSFMSKNRGAEISSDLKYRNLCKGEYYEGRPVIAYNWSPSKKLSWDLIDKRNSDIFTDEYSGNSLFPIRLWKIVKSLGDYYFSKRFIGLMTDYKNENQENDSSVPDFEFVKYAKESFVVIDYSRIKDNHLSLAIQYFPSDVKVKLVEEEKAGQYSKIAKDLVLSAAKLAFDPECYETCASGYCRNVIVNAMLTDSVGAEHILLTKKLEQKSFFAEAIEVDLADDMDLIQERPKKEVPELYSQHQVDNIAIGEAISRINKSSLIRFESVVELLEEMLPGINDDVLGIPRLDCAELLRHIKYMCEKIDYTYCQLYLSIR